MGNLQTQISSNSVEIANLKESSHVHNNKTVLDNITDEQLNLWNSSLNNAKAYTDSEVDEVQNVIYDSFISNKITSITPIPVTTSIIIV